MSRKSAYVAVLATALATYAIAAYASLWVAPQALRLATPHAFASFQEGSLFGIQLAIVVWTLWSAVCVLLVLRRVNRSEAWARGGRRRFLSIAGSVLMIFGLIGTAAWLPFLQVDLAMEHVIPSQQRDASASMLFGLAWVTAAGAILAALVLRVVGDAIDGPFRKAPPLPTA